jgi:hypothetical protein
MGGPKTTAPALQLDGQLGVDSRSAARTAVDVDRAADGLDSVDQIAGLRDQPLTRVTSRWERRLHCQALRERSRPDRHPGHEVAFDEEAELARAIEPFAANVRRHDALVAGLPNFPDCEPDSLADELAVAPSLIASAPTNFRPQSSTRPRRRTSRGTLRCCPRSPPRTVGYRSWNRIEHGHHV